MILQDIQLIEDMAHADRLKADAPDSGVSVDALFSELRRLRRLQKRVAESQGTPPDWFYEELTKQRGRALTIGEFLLLAGRESANKRERNEVGVWLRAIGLKPRKYAGKAVFDI